MSELVVVSYPDINRAEQVLATLQQLRSQYLIDLEDACYITKDATSNVKLHQGVNMTRAGAGYGAMWGGLWGLLLGALVLQPIAGMAIGAAVGGGTGAIAGKLSDYGIGDTFIKQLSASLPPNSSAIFVLVRRSTPDKVLPEVGKYGGTVLHTSLPADAEARLQAALAQGMMTQEAPGAGAHPSA